MYCLDFHRSSLIIIQSETAKQTSNLIVLTRLQNYNLYTTANAFITYQFTYNYAIHSKKVKHLANKSRFFLTVYTLTKRINVDSGERIDV